MEYHQEINLEFITVCGDIQQSSKAHGLTYQILQWGYTATVCVRVYVHVCVHVCMHACVCMCACLCLHVCACTHMQTQTRTHTHSHSQGRVTPPWQVGPCALDCTTFGSPTFWGTEY